jgi:hypothetical protein
MNRREFWTTAGGATALTLAGSSFRTLWAAETNTPTIPFYVKGLAMVSFDDPDHLTIALPEAPHHGATLLATTRTGTTEEHALRGHGRLIGSAGSNTKPDVRIPSLVDVQELYPGARPKLESSPTIIRIPWTSVGAVSQGDLSEDRWTFVTRDTGEEVITFRPRKVAESLRFDLVSSGVLRMNDGEFSVSLGEVQEVSTEFVPTSHDTGDFTDHFAFYMPYVEVGPNAPEIKPQQVGAPATGSPMPMPTLGHSFAAVGARMWPWSTCFPFRVDPA